MLSIWHRYGKFLNTNAHKVLDPAQWELLQKEFRFTLVKACGPPWLLKVRELFQGQAARYRTMCLHSHLAMIVKDEKLVRAVLTRDKVTALKLSTASWKKPVQLIADELKKKDGSLVDG